MVSYKVLVHDNGTREWYVDGRLHREDGPAIEYRDGNVSWYLKGTKLTKSEHEYEVKKLSVKELTVAEIEAVLGYKIKIVKG